MRLILETDSKLYISWIYISLVGQLLGCQTAEDNPIEVALTDTTAACAASDANVFADQEEAFTENADSPDTNSANEGGSDSFKPDSPQPTETKDPVPPTPPTDEDASTESTPDSGTEATDDTDNRGQTENPGQAGKYDVAQSSAQLQLEGGVFGQSVPLIIFSPQGTGPFPAVVMNHGFMLAPSSYFNYGKHLASWGYVVAMPDMPANILSPSTDIESKDIVVAALDWLEIQANVDASKIAAAGHSRGGKISLLTAVNDARIKAVFGIDPVDSTGPSFLNQDPTKFVSVTPELMPELDIPLALIGETTNSGAGIGGQACAPAEENFQQYYLHAKGPVVEIEILGANHMSFLDNPNCGLPCTMCPAGQDDPAQTQALTIGYFTAFLNVVLKEQNAYKSYLNGTQIDSDKAQGLVLFQSKNAF